MSVEQTFRQWWGRYTGTAPDGIDADHAWESAKFELFGLCDDSPLVRFASEVKPGVNGE